MKTDGEKFIHLKDENTYFPGLWNLCDNGEMLRHWSYVFRSNFDHIMSLLERYRDSETLNRATQARVEMDRLLDSLEQDDNNSKFPTVHHITIFREQLFSRYGIEDPYREEKDLGNKRAIAMYPRVVKRIDLQPDFATKLRECCLRIFAGNIYDLGSVEIARKHQKQNLRYGDLMRRVRTKKWFLNDLDIWVDSLNHEKRKNRLNKILFFVDNAGHDFVCGCIPLARTLAEIGHSVVIAVNETPSLNDITFEEALILFNRLQTIDPVLRALKDKSRLRLITSGNNVPGIDFRSVGKFVNLDGMDATQLILEGQGRAIETNWHTRFGIDCVRLSTVKESTVATAIGAKSLDMILRFDGTP